MKKNEDVPKKNSSAQNAQTFLHIYIGVRIKEFLYVSRLETFWDNFLGHARSLTERAAEEVKIKFDLDTVYGDTDSIFVNLDLSINRDNIQNAIDQSKKIGQGLIPDTFCHYFF